MMKELNAYDLPFVFGGVCICDNAGGKYIPLTAGGAQNNISTYETCRRRCCPAGAIRYRLTNHAWVNCHRSVNVTRNTIGKIAEALPMRAEDSD